MRRLTTWSSRGWAVARRVGMPPELVGVRPIEVYADPRLLLPKVWLPRGRWKSGPMHTFVDDYRQEFFWRRPMEGLLVALAAGVCTAPDFSVFADDPPQWAAYQVWRSAVLAQFWQSAGVRVYPVVSLRGNSYQYVRRGSAWAIRGPERATDPDWYSTELEVWARRARPGLLVVFGRSLPDNVNLPCAVERRALVPAGGYDCTNSGEAQANGWKRQAARADRRSRAESRSVDSGGLRRSAAGVRANAVHA